jgi:hypothetical protein
MLPEVAWKRLGIRGSIASGSSRISSPRWQFLNDFSSKKRRKKLKFMKILF